jgi:hypothetical protein
MGEWVSTYEPNRAQSNFHASSAVEKLLLGGVGGGKSLAGVHESVYCLSDNTESDHAIVSPTYPMLRDVAEFDQLVVFLVRVLFWRRS